MSERAPLSPAAGLARTATIPPPPPRRPRRSSPPDQWEQDQQAPAATVQVPVASGPAQRPRQKAGRPRASAAADTMRPVTLSLTAALVRQLKERARSDRVTQPEILLDALVASREDLPRLLEEATTAPASDGLFLRRSTPRGSAEPMATLSLRLLSRNVEAIDELVTTHGAPSRSALCAAALRHYLQVLPAR